MLKASYPQHYLSHLQNEAGRPTLPLHQKGIRDPHLWGTGKCLTLGLTAARWILLVIYLRIQSLPWAGPRLYHRRPTGLRTHPRKRKRKKPRGSLPHPSWKSQTPAAQGRALPKQFKTGFWCVAVATTPAARQLRRRSKRRQGYSLRGWGGEGEEAWWEISFGLRHQGRGWR